MKRRICKKHHLGDYAEYGTLVRLEVSNSNFEELLIQFEEVVDKYGLSAWGGGGNCLITPKVKGNYRIPTLIEQFMIGLMSTDASDSMTFIVHSPHKSIDQAPFIDYINQVFGDAEYQLDVHAHINLWTM